MKRIITAVLLAVLALLLVSCGAGSDGGGEKSADAVKVDVDLTELSDTMVYSEITNISNQAEEYLGKTFRIKGTFAVLDGHSRYYFMCGVNDATACCTQGLEFILKGEPDYPDGYPEVGSEITVRGVFDTYMEGKRSYCQLIDAVIEG